MIWWWSNWPDHRFFSILFFNFITKVLPISFLFCNIHYSYIPCIHSSIYMFAHIKQCGFTVVITWTYYFLYTRNIIVEAFYSFIKLFSSKNIYCTCTPLFFNSAQQKFTCKLYCETRHPSNWQTLQHTTTELCFIHLSFQSTLRTSRNLGRSVHWNWLRIFTSWCCIYPYYITLFVCLFVYKIIFICCKRHRWT